MSKTKQAPGRGKKYVKKNQIKKIQRNHSYRKVFHKFRLKRAMIPTKNTFIPQNEVNLYEKQQYRAEVSVPIALDEGILVLWDDQAEGVCHYMPRSDLKVLGRSNKFYPGSRVVYSHGETEWTGRIPKSVSEVIECCCMRDAPVDLRTYPKRQVLVLWDNPSAGLCHYMYTKDLRIIDDSYRIYRGTRVAIRWKGVTLTGQVPPEIYDKNDLPMLPSANAISNIEKPKEESSDEPSVQKREVDDYVITEGFWNRVDKFCRDINLDDLQFFEGRIRKYQLGEPLVLSSLTCESPHSKCKTLQGEDDSESEDRIPSFGTTASAPVSRRNSVVNDGNDLSLVGRPKSENGDPHHNGNDFNVSVLSASMSQHPVNGAGDGVREMETDIPSESSTSVADAGPDVSSRYSVSSQGLLTVEVADDPLGQMHRFGGNHVCDEEPVRLRLSSSLAPRRRSAVLSDRRLLSSKTIFQKRLNSVRNRTKMKSGTENSTSSESVLKRMKDTNSGELAVATTAIVARYQRRFPSCPWNEFAESVLSNAENAEEEFSDDEVMEAIMQKQMELRAVENRNRTTFEVLVERMKETMARQEILKRVTAANERVTQLSDSIVKMLRLKYRSKGKTKRKYMKLRDEARAALSERETVMEELKTFDIAHGTKLIFKSD